MSTRSAQLHLAVCDGCGESLEDREDTDLCWGISPEEAIDTALGAGWEEIGDRLLCPDCQWKEEQP